MVIPVGSWDVHACQPGAAGPGIPNTELIGKLIVAISGPDPQPVCTPTSVDLSGSIAFPGGINATIAGFWDDIAQKITFLATDDRSGVTHVYTGFMFLSPVRFTLAGHFEAFSIAGGSPIGGYAERVLYGWYALIQAP